MTESYQFCRATASDAEEILRIYRSLIGSAGCTWVEEYPDAEMIAEDLACAGLYTLRDETGRIAAVASVVKDEDLDDLSWPVPLQNPCELARVAVPQELQGRGLASCMVQHCIELARRAGYDGLRLLVSCEHAVARHLYEKHQFVRYGTVLMYGDEYDYMQLTFLPA